MMNSIEAEGSSIDAAIETALRELGVPRERVTIDILNDASRGFLGLGGKKARVKATLRPDVGDEVVIASSSDAAGIVAGIEASLDSDADDRETATATPDEANAAPKREPEAAAPRARRNDQERGARRKPNRAAEPVRREPRERRPAPSIEPATVERAREVLQEIVSHVVADAKVSARIEGDHIELDVDGDSSGILIGRKGQMLDALEYIVGRILARDEERSIHLIVDSGGYRERRRQSLEEMARRMGDEAKRKGRAVKLNAMSPRDRRIVHMVLQLDRSLTTRSSGQGHFRKLVIVPSGGGEVESND